MRMQWRHLLFMHWPVEPSMLRPLIPDSLEIDTFDGRAWVGLVPFTMRDVLPTIIPKLPGVSDLPAISAFHECNVRTYVTPKSSRSGEPPMPGVWFFSLDAASRAAVWGARTFFHLPYFHARMSLRRDGDRIEYATRRPDQPSAALQCVWTAGDRLPPSQPGEIAHFLTERYCLYVTDRRGQLRCSRIWHEPWPLRNVELNSLEDGLLTAAGITVDHRQPPLLHHADELDVRVWSLERC